MQMWFTGEYREVVENQRLAYTESMSDANGNVLSPADMGMPDGHPTTTEVTVELEDVDGRWVDDEPVTGRRSLEHAVRQELPQLGDVHLDRVAGRIRRILAPERVDQGVARDDLVRLQQQGGEERPGLLPAECDRLTVGADGKRPEQLELGANRRHRRVLARFQRSFSVASNSTFCLSRMTSIFTLSPGLCLLSTVM